MRRLITRLILLLALAAPAIPDAAYAQGKRRAKPSARKQGTTQSPAPQGAKDKDSDKSKDKDSDKSKDKDSDKSKVFDFTGLDVTGQLRSPQLMYFLERATEELQRASLERRSFIPEMVRTIDEEAL